MYQIVTSIVTDHRDIPMENAQIASGWFASQQILYIFCQDVPTVSYNTCTFTKHQLYTIQSIKIIC